MNEVFVPTPLDLIKALSEPERLKIVGAISLEAQTLAAIRATTGLPFRKVFNHLAFLEAVGMVRVIPAEKKDEARYVLIPATLEKMARLELERDCPLAAPGEEVERQKALEAYLNPDGTIRQIPNSRQHADKLRLLLQHLAGSFESGRTYTEREVNTILKAFHVDFSGLRRDLVDSGLLARERDGSAYWRPVERQEGRPQ